MFSLAIACYFIACPFLSPFYLSIHLYIIHKSGTNKLISVHGNGKGNGTAPAMQASEMLESVAGKLPARAIHAIIEASTKNAAVPENPCVFDAWEGEISTKRLKVTVEEAEENSKLCDPACFNDIFVHNGKIVGVPYTEKFAKVRKNGVPVGISYISVVANLAAARIEEAARVGTVGTVGGGTIVQVKMVKIPSEVNLKVEPWAMRYITDNNKKIDVRGPVFMTVRAVVLS